jgi:hypothetical protein
MRNTQVFDIRIYRSCLFQSSSIRPTSLLSMTIMWNVSQHSKVNGGCKGASMAALGIRRFHYTFLFIIIFFSFAFHYLPKTFGHTESQ